MFPLFLRVGEPGRLPIGSDTIRNALPGPSCSIYSFHRLVGWRSVAPAGSGLDRRRSAGQLLPRAAAADRSAGVVERHPSIGIEKMSLLSALNGNGHAGGAGHLAILNCESVTARAEVVTF